MATKKNMLKHSAVEGVLCAHESDLPGRKAVGVDPEIKASNLRRLRRIEGQVRGIEKMIDEDRYCIDVLTQLSATRAALESVSLQLLADHTEHCVAEAIRSGKGNQKVRELNEAVERLVRS